MPVAHEFVAGGKQGLLLPVPADPGQWHGHRGHAAVSAPLF